MGSFSLIHWIILGVVILLLFGGNRFSAMMSDVAKGLKNFKQGLSEDDKPGEGTERSDARRDHRSDPRQLPPHSNREPIDVTPRRTADPVPPSSTPSGDETNRE